MNESNPILKECPFCKSSSNLYCGMMTEEFWWTDETRDCAYVSIMCTHCNLIKFRIVHTPSLIESVKSSLIESWNKRN